MTIEEIIAALAAGTTTEQQANDQLHALMAADKTRVAYACAALTGLLATGEKRSSKDDAARDAFAYADAMVLSESGQLPEPQDRRPETPIPPRPFGPPRFQVQGKPPAGTAEK